jgi:hypothetical protein
VLVHTRVGENNKNKKDNSIPTSQSYLLLLPTVLIVVSPSPSYALSNHFHRRSSSLKNIHKKDKYTQKKTNKPLKIFEIFKKKLKTKKKRFFSMSSLPPPQSRKRRAASTAQDSDSKPCSDCHGPRPLADFVREGHPNRPYKTCKRCRVCGQSGFSVPTADQSFLLCRTVTSSDQPPSALCWPSLNLPPPIRPFLSPKLP